MNWIKGKPTDQKLEMWYLVWWSICDNPTLAIRSEGQLYSYDDPVDKKPLDETYITHHIPIEKPEMPEEVR